MYILTQKIRVPYFNKEMFQNTTFNFCKDDQDYIMGALIPNFSSSISIQWNTLDPPKSMATLPIVMSQLPATSNTGHFDDTKALVIQISLQPLDEMRCWQICAYSGPPRLVSLHT